MPRCCSLPSQSERPKTARELCSGLDEAGNDLGDISLGFFLRQVGYDSERYASRDAGKGGAVEPRRAPAYSLRCVVNFTQTCELLHPAGRMLEHFSAEHFGK